MVESREGEICVGGAVKNTPRAGIVLLFSPPFCVFPLDQALLDVRFRVAMEA